ncbi:MAG: deoxynucleoside kinase [Candidatus Marinimicrobia bacterium]|jgi:deoxyadenosine/deoxycytidine kinase|nr:deoxynucleoside kinase [Candidatus Neomarinimicrobiota bacterium]MDD4961980.1 deoxynucleoside kinase [Candidatus Neomarinimicrobiota bacterium]MDD5709945.1 deoxynucleoside kinase [Candidatus Neomarinimicrobiota bacterium]MDX9778316.1 deoxynucleoside kinase [bacterium]
MTGPAYYIAIEGVIGVGKTSLAKILCKQLGSRLILEKFEENPFLSDFYGDRQRYAFQTQLFFLLSRYRQQLELMQTDMFHRSLITDYIFAKDRLFAYINLDEKELHLYDQLYSILSREITKPDLVIYLQSDTERLMKNIDLRGRSYERNMDREYIDSLNQFYNQFFFHYDQTPLLIINTTDIDFVNKKEDLEEVMKYIQQPPAGTKYYKAGSP